MTRWTLFLVSSAIGGCGSAAVGAHPGGTSIPPGSDAGTVASDGGVAAASDAGGMASEDGTTMPPPDLGSMGLDDGGNSLPDQAPIVPFDSGPPPADPCVAMGTCPANTWINVTPKGITIPTSGLRSVVRDPSRPSDLYLGSGEAGIWKSTDYGNTWAMINMGFGYVPQGLCLAVLPTQPSTLLIGASCGCGKVHKSTDGGATFRTTGGGFKTDLYSFAVDPYDGNHILSGFHEQDGIAESTDAGETWHLVGTGGFPSGGISWYPTFLDTGVANTTSKTWFAIAQDGGSPVITRDGGNSWTIPTGLQGLKHPHGEAQIFQRQQTLFVPGVNGGAANGVYRSTDFGMTFTMVTKPTAAAIAWGTPNHVYSMWAWSCFGCAIDPKFMVGSATGDTWTSPSIPKTMLMGADHVAVTSDGSHYVFVAAMRNSGLWRYVEQ